MKLKVSRTKHQERQKDLGLHTDPLFYKIYFIILTTGLIIVWLIMPLSDGKKSPFKRGDEEKEDPITSYCLS